MTTAKKDAFGRAREFMVTTARLIGYRVSEFISTQFPPDDENRR